MSKRALYHNNHGRLLDSEDAWYDAGVKRTLEGFSCVHKLSIGDQLRVSQHIGSLPQMGLINALGILTQELEFLLFLDVLVFKHATDEVIVLLCSLICDSLA